MKCCCNYGCAVADEWPEFECYACPIHKAGLASPNELCKRHKREKRENGAIFTDDGRSLWYLPHIDPNDPQLKVRMQYHREHDNIGS